LPDDYENDDPGNCVIYSITFIYFLTKIVYWATFKTCCVCLVVHCRTRRDPDVVILDQNLYIWVYKDLPKKHHLLRKVPNC
jgi:hypothetical protein